MSICSYTQLWGDKIMRHLGHNLLLVKVARLYYEQNMTQSEIGTRLRISRQKVQRLIEQANREGIVQITIRPVMDSFADLEKALEANFGLKEAVIVETTAYDDQLTVAREVGAGAAEYLLRVIQPNDTIALSWGGSLLGMVNTLHANSHKVNLPKVKVVQCLGGLGDPNNETHAADLTRRLAQVFGGQAILLPTPAVAGSLNTKEAYLSDPYVSQCLKLAQQANLAFMGIGAPRSDSILVQEGNIISWATLLELIQQGAAGDINLRYFDSAGIAIPSQLNECTIGLTLEEIRAIDMVVGVAGGAAKYYAIMGAMTGKFIDVLVTDHVTAQRLVVNFQY